MEMADLTAKGLVAFAKSKLGTAYVYGMKGEVMSLEKYNWLKATYGSAVWDSDKNKVGKVCVDCSGLISWYCGSKYLYGSSDLYSKATKRGLIKDIADAPVGAALWRKGHIGVYIGNGQCIEARGSAYGTVQTKVSERDFTHWLVLPWIDYTVQEATIVTPTTPAKTTATATATTKAVTTTQIDIILNGVQKQVAAINKDDFNYVKLRDLADDQIVVDYDSVKKLPIIKVIEK